jgi:hypothetical protein
MSVRIDCERADYVSFTILNFDQTFPGYPTIDYKSILETHSLKHLKKGQEEDNNGQVNKSVEKRISTTNTSEEKKDHEEKEGKESDDKDETVLVESSPDLSSRPTLKRNRYDNIIERLERKYCGSAAVTPHSESTDEDDVEEVTQPTRRKKRAAVGSDYYDMDDPFIDDADNIASVETQIKMSQIQTKHDGFFVSSGVLELNATSGMKLISESQREEAMATIASTFPDLASKLESIIESLTSFKSLKTFPPSLQSELLELDSLALSHDIDLLRQSSKTKSPYCLCLNYFFQNICKLNSGEIVTEDMEGWRHIWRKQIMKNRNSSSGPSPVLGKEASGNTLREILSYKVQEVAAKIRSKVEARSSEEKKDSSGE